MCTLLVCAGYCEACITRNFSIKAWKSVSQSYARGEWSCYACQPAPLRLVPQLGSKLAVSFKDEGLCTGEIVGVEGPTNYPRSDAAGTHTQVHAVPTQTQLPKAN